MPSGAATLTRFERFADRDARFFKQLARNQSREWFAAHRDEYERGWLRPMKALLAELREGIDPFFPQHPLGEPKVFRIFRDVRFSKDKSPYKTPIGGYVPIGHAGTGPALPAPVYLHLGPERFACAGHYMMLPDQLARYRAAVLDEKRGAELAGIVARLAKKGFALGGHETLKQVPRGVDPAHPRADLLKRKGLIVAFPELPKELLVSRALLDWLVRHVKQSAPLVEPRTTRMARYDPPRRCRRTARSSCTSARRGAADAGSPAGWSTSPGERPRDRRGGMRRIAPCVSRRRSAHLVGAPPSWTSGLLTSSSSPVAAAGAAAVPPRAAARPPAEPSSPDRK
jgi:uncharacterized protein (TIGR02453 family)